jgi:hypothetical protein
VYAMNLNFKLTSQKLKLAHYEENMKNSLYILQWGEKVCAKIINDHLHSPFVIKCQKWNEKSKMVYSSSSTWAPSSDVSSSSSESGISR